MTGLRAWTTLLLVSALFFIITAATFSSLGLALPAMMAELNWSFAQAGTGFSLLAVLCGITSYIPAALIRRFGVRTNFLVGALVMALAFVCLAQAQGLTLYLFGAALAGFGFTLLATVPGTYLLTRLFARPSFAFGLYFTLGGLGGVAGPLLYGWIAGPQQDWRAFWLACAVAVAAIAIVAAFFCDTRSDVGREAEADPAITTGAWRVKDAMRTHQFAFLAAAYSAFLICDISVNSASPSHLAEIGTSPEMAARLMSIWALLNVGARLAGGILNSFVSARLLLIGALGLLAAGMAALALGNSPVLLTLYVIGIGLGSGLTFFASTILLLDYFGRKPNLELFSLLNLISTIGAAAPWAAGVTRDASGSFAPFFLAIAVAMMGMTVLALFLRPPRSAA
ncbi:MAG TPA: MFS transporter [Rhizomicrobium sp.]|nr:MFS transporter [Rhizomicrobium sp.]